MPASVLERIAGELLDWRGTGVSVMETSHRSAAFVECAAEAEADLRALLGVPDDYGVLFMQGGASAQFALTVMNLAGGDDGSGDGHLGPAAFADTGHWSRKAIATARRLVPVHVACTAARDEVGELRIPDPREWSIPDDAVYVHLCDNETIDGVAFEGAGSGGCNSGGSAGGGSEVDGAAPDGIAPGGASGHESTLDALEAVAPGLPIVCDMSSSILSRPIDVSRYALIYAGAQKNIGPAGLTLVIASPEAMARSRAAGDLPGVFSYAATEAAGSMLNTPPTFAWYAAGLVFRWLREQGGLPAIDARNRAQAARVYAAVDELAPFANGIAAPFRSIMNVPFTLADEASTEAFLARCAAAGLVGLKGHKSVGGCRASLYNAQTDAAVDALIETMRAHAADSGGKASRSVSDTVRSRTSSGDAPVHARADAPRVGR